MPATGSILLDTSVVVAALRRVAGIEARLHAADQLWLPLFALGELEYGVNRSSHPARQAQALAAFTEGVTLLAPGEATAKEYGRIKAALARAGTPIPENDIWIAAQAQEHGFALATRDEHFQRIDGLTVLDWR